MIKFISLDGEFEFKWEYHFKETRGYMEKYPYDSTGYIIAKLKGVELIDWLQTYGLTPAEMFNGKNIFGYDRNEERKIDLYNLRKVAEKWKKENQETIKKNPWTVVGMNGGYVLMSNGSKENTVELGSASIVNMNNSNTVNNDINVKATSRANLL